MRIRQTSRSDDSLICLNDKIWPGGGLQALAIPFTSLEIIMRVTDVYELRTEDVRSELPPGGNPAIDRAYSEWVAEFITEIHPRVLDRLTGVDGSIVATATQVERKINTFSITNHLYKWILGWSFPGGTGPNYGHRLRFIAVQFHLRRPALIAEAESYIDRIIDELRRS